MTFFWFPHLQASRKGLIIGHKTKIRKQAPTWPQGPAPRPRKYLRRKLGTRKKRKPIPGGRKNSVWQNKQQPSGLSVFRNVELVTDRPSGPEKFPEQGQNGCKTLPSLSKKKNGAHPPTDGGEWALCKVLLEKEPFPQTKTRKNVSDPFHRPQEKGNPLEGKELGGDPIRKSYLFRPPQTSLNPTFH